MSYDVATLRELAVRTGLDVAGVAIACFGYLAPCVSPGRHDRIDVERSAGGGNRENAAAPFRRRPAEKSR